MEIPGLFTNSKRQLVAEVGQVLFREGEPGAEMYGVISGEVELRLGSRVIATVGPNEVFGEMALIDNSPRSLDAVAVQPTELAVIDRHRFLFLVTETPTFALQVMAAMADRLRAMTVAAAPG